MTYPKVTVLSRRPTSPRRLQRGQALAEMAILAAVLVPFFLLVPTLGKYMHIKQSTQQAARAAAWAATVTPDYEWSGFTAKRAEHRKLLIDRYFADSRAAIKSRPADSHPQARLGDPLLNTFSNQALVERTGIELAPYKNEGAGALMAAFNKADKLIALLPGDFPPNKDGLMTAELMVRPENLKTADGSPARYLAPFDSINLEMHGTHTILAGAWNAAGAGVEGSPSASRARSVRNQVKSIVWTSFLEPLGDVTESLGALEDVPLVGVPLRLRIGYIEPDIVPADRLKPYSP